MYVSRDTQEGSPSQWNITRDNLEKRRWSGKMDWSQQCKKSHNSTTEEREGLALEQLTDIIVRKAKMRGGIESDCYQFRGGYYYSQIYNVKQIHKKEAT